MASNTARVQPTAGSSDGEGNIPTGDNITQVFVDLSHTEVSTTTAKQINWAVSHMSRTQGKSLELIGYLTKVATPLGPMPYDKANPLIKESAIKSKEIMLKTYADLVRLDALCAKTGITLVLKVRAGAQPHCIAVEEALKCGATQVVLESSMQSYAAYFKKTLTCGVIRLRSKGNWDIIKEYSHSVCPALPDLKENSPTPDQPRNSVHPSTQNVNPVTVKTLPSIPPYEETPGLPPSPSCTDYPYEETPGLPPSPSSSDPPCEQAAEASTSTDLYPRPKEWTNGNSFIRNPSWPGSRGIGSQTRDNHYKTRGGNHDDFDVFISHRGTIKNFVGHLDEAFHRSSPERPVHSFLDRNALGIGDCIFERLQVIIKRVPVGLVIFTPDFAESQWCLDELSLMLQNKSTQVLPVFYNVKPSDIRFPSKGQLKTGWNKTVKRVSTETKAKWIDALAKAADIVGWEFCSRGDKMECDLVKEVVLKVSEIEAIKSRLSTQKHPAELFESGQFYFCEPRRWSTDGFWSPPNGEMIIFHTGQGTAHPPLASISSLPSLS